MGKLLTAGLKLSSFSSGRETWQQSLSKPLARGSFPVYVSVVCLDMGVIWHLSIYAVLYDPKGTDFSLHKSVNSFYLGLGHDIKGYMSELVK